MIYDAVMRIPFASWVLILAIAQSTAILKYFDAAQVNVESIVHLAMLTSTLAFVLLLATAVIFRMRPSAKMAGLEARVSALGGTFLIYVIVAFPRHNLSILAEAASTLLIMIGNIGSIITLSQLGRSFSLMAECRRLVTSGPYRYIRHPLYVAEEIAVIGIFMQFASVWTALLLAMQIGFQLRRMHNEERVLSANLPEYDAYRQNTARLIPGLY